MASPDPLLLIAVAALSVCVVLLVLGALLVVRDTVRRRGRWGMNFKPARCTRCGEPAPAVRMPANWRQTLWGGWTCPQCGFELDKWGNPEPRQPFPAEWSAKLGEGRPAGARRADERHTRGGDYRE